MLEVYTDGSSRGNPGSGGYGYVILDKNKIIGKGHKQFENVTNNRMELMAILHALECAAAHQDEFFIIYTDSAYCYNICNSWIFNWARNNWQRPGNKPVQNIDVIQDIFHHVKKNFPNFEIRKCGGHCGIIGNELADSLACNNIIKFNNIKKKNNIIDIWEDFFI